MTTETLLWGVIVTLSAAGFIRLAYVMRTGGMTVMGEEVAPATIAMVLVLFALMWGIIVAIKLGFISGYAP